MIKQAVEREVKKQQNATSVCSEGRVIVERRGVISDLLQHITRQLPQSVPSLYPFNLQCAVSSHSLLLPCGRLSPCPHVHKDSRCYSDGARQGNAMRWQLSPRAYLCFSVFPVFCKNPMSFCPGMHQSICVVYCLACRKRGMSDCLSLHVCFMRCSN